MDKHYMSNEYKVLCNEVGNMAKKDQQGRESSNGWIVVDNEYNKGSNFKAALYYKNGQYAIAFAGTDIKNIKDIGADIKMGATGDSKQIRQAKEFTKNMVEKYGLNSENTVSIGHSEGGTEATVVGVSNGLPTVTYNAFKVGGKYIEKGKDYSDLVTNYRDPHDPISKLGKNVGETYIVPSSQTGIKKNTPLGYVDAHRLDNMGDCTKSVTPQVYKQKIDSKFVDDIKDVDITREDIGNMSSDLFRVYEKEIDNRMVNGKIKSNVKRSSAEGDGRWVTINGNHVLINN